MASASSAVQSIRETHGPTVTGAPLVLTSLDGTLRVRSLRPATVHGSDGATLLESAAAGDDATPAFCIAWTFCWVTSGLDAN